MSSSLANNSTLKKLSKGLPVPDVDFLYPGGNVALSPNANGDYSVTPQLFYRQANPPSFIFGQDAGFMLTDLSVLLSSPSPVVRANYGTIAAGITNGYTLGFLVDLPGQPVDQFLPATGLIQSNSNLWDFFEDFEALAFSVNPLIRFKPRQPNGLRSRYNFFVPAEWNVRIAVELNDDFTGLTDHYFKFSGYQCANPENWGFAQ